MDPSPVFINLSNHPYEKWSEEQRKAAEELGEVKELPFPQVSPDCSTGEVESMCNGIINQIKEMAPVPYVSTIHIMGEMTLTYNLVGILKALGYNCVASTTQRDVRTDEDGNKVTRFNFVKFREY